MNKLIFLVPLLVLSCGGSNDIEFDQPVEDDVYNYQPGKKDKHDPCGNIKEIDGNKFILKPYCPFPMLIPTGDPEEKFEDMIIDKEREY